MSILEEILAEAYNKVSLCAVHVDWQIGYLDYFNSGDTVTRINQLSRRLRSKNIPNIWVVFGKQNSKKKVVSDFRPRMPRRKLITNGPDLTDPLFVKAQRDPFKNKRFKNHLTTNNYTSIILTGVSAEDCFLEAAISACSSSTIDTVLAVSDLTDIEQKMPMLEYQDMIKALVELNKPTASSKLHFLETSIVQSVLDLTA